jgi:hypothetical protein
MQAKDIDWSIIRGALISLVLCISISSALVTASYYFKDAMTEDFNRNNALFMNISQRYLRIDEEAKLITTYLPEFIELYNRGVIGQEQRLNWIEVLKDVEAANKLPGLSYTINSQEQHIPGYPVDLGRYRLSVSKMSLTLSLLHEGDLLNLIDGLNARANGTFTVNACKFGKAGEIVMDNPRAANLSVDCELDWYTIKLSDGTEIKV